MSEKMTSGEIAKKAGVSQKAVRLYDEKGLLKPTDYSEGNYRLYDKAALQVLEKIVALKQIGFSLEEIYESLNGSGDADIEEILQEQVRSMEAKKYQIEKIIQIINGILARNEGKALDWDIAAEIIQSIMMDQKKDENHFEAIKHSGDELDWYVRIYRTLQLKEQQKVLDLGCGFGKVWRNNQEEIPGGTKIYAYDLHGTWADDFEKYLEENKDSMPEGVTFDLQFMDVEEADTWKRIKEQKYDRIVAHYIADALKDTDTFLERCSSVLSEAGVLSWNCEQVSAWSTFFKEILDKAGVPTGFIVDEIKEAEEAKASRIAQLKLYFSKVEMVTLNSRWVYDSVEDMYGKLISRYPGKEKEFAKKEHKIKEVMKQMLGENSTCYFESVSEFWHCGK